MPQFTRGQGLVKSKVPLRANLHPFPQNTFGSIADLVRPSSRERDTLIIACSELGSAPDYVSFAKRERFVILQHLAASMPSQAEFEMYQELCCGAIAKLFEKYDFRHVIVCGHLGCGVIPYWLQPADVGDTDVGGFRRRFELGTHKLVEDNYFPSSVLEKIELLIFEHVLCQIDNLLTHPFISQRVRSQTTSFYGWVVDDQSARVYGYQPDESAYMLI